MKLYNFLLEWDIKWGYAGRGIIKNDSPIIFMNIFKPKPIGFIWAMPDGKIYNNDELILIDNTWNSYKNTHKTLLARLYLPLKLQITGNLRDDVDIIHDNYQVFNPRGRISNGVLYIWPYDTFGVDGNERTFKMNAQKTIDLCYRYISEK
jgi:hypothetical protein